MKKLLIISGKGGTGKTTVASAIIRMSGARAIADCDVDAPNLHILNSFDSEPQDSDFIGSFKAKIDPEKCVDCGKCSGYCRFDAIVNENGKCQVSEFACEGCGVCEYICPQKAIEMIPDVAGNLSLYKGERVFSTAALKMGRGNSGKLVMAVKDALYNAAHNAPLAVFDGSPGVGCPVMASISGMDLCLIVTEPTMSGKSDLERIAETVSRCFVKSAVCINKYDINVQISEDIEKWCADNDIPFVGKIQYDGNAAKAVNTGKSILEYDCPAADALKEIYEKISSLLGGVDNDS